MSSYEIKIAWAADARVQAAMPGERITVSRVDHWIEEVE